MDQQDLRPEAYRDLHAHQLTEDRDKNVYSAEVLLRIALSYFPVRSVLDVGCGLGTWLSVAQKLGLEVAGVEGPWCEPAKLEISPDLVTITDLEKPISLGRRFDLAICLEVAEHLYETAATELVKTLTEHAELVMFSAAIPFQGGHHHVNEQFLDFWVERFAEQGYRPVDIFRSSVWTDRNVHWWLRQNLVLFATEPAVESNSKLKAESLIERPLSIVHPDFYLSRLVDSMKEQSALIERLIQLGRARWVDLPQGRALEII